MVDKESIKVGSVYTAPRWKGARKVDQIFRVRIDGANVLRVDYIDQRTSRSGWALLEDFAKVATLQEPV